MDNLKLTESLISQIESVVGTNTSILKLTGLDFLNDYVPESNPVYIDPFTPPEKPDVKFIWNMFPINFILGPNRWFIDALWWWISIWWAPVTIYWNLETIGIWLWFDTVSWIFWLLNSPFVVWFLFVFACYTIFFVLATVATITAVALTVGFTVPGTSTTT